jgi:glutathione S-transferase
MAGSGIKLVYFQGLKGRAGAITDAFQIGKIPYEYEGVDFPTFGAQKAAGRFPLGSVPVIQVGDSELIPQSNAILRFAGRRAGLYPDDLVDALKVDAILDSTEESLKNLSNRGNGPEELKAIREKISAEDIPKFFRYFEKVAPAEGDFLVGQKHTVADLKLYHLIALLQSGRLDHLTLDLAAYPKVHGWYTRYSAFHAGLHLE